MFQIIQKRICKETKKLGKIIDKANSISAS